MAEYIKKAELIKKLYLETAEGRYSPTIKTIKEFPAVDVQAVRHGRWFECYIDSYHYSGICSVCGRVSNKNLTESLYEYCPRCGARMDLGEENNEI